MKVFDTAVIGLGPTGATLANLLAMQGLSVLILEREAQIYDLPRAVHFDDEVMRVFQNIGIANELLPMVRVNPGMRFVDKENNLLLDWPRPQGHHLAGLERKLPTTSARSRALTAQEARGL